MTNALPPIPYTPAVSPGPTPAEQRVAAFVLTFMALVTMAFTAWWARKLAVIHILSYHGCMCGRLSRENMAAFGLLPLLALLIAHGAYRSTYLYAVAVGLLSVAVTAGVYGLLWCMYFGLIYSHAA